MERHPPARRAIWQVKIGECDRAANHSFTQNEEKIDVAAGRVSVVFERPKDDDFFDLRTRGQQFARIVVHVPAHFRRVNGYDFDRTQ